jgi:hypothetical protein
VTPNVGAHNVTFSSGGFRPNAAASPGNGPFVVWQNNSAGELILNTTIGNPKYGTSAYVQAGPGTVFLTPTVSYYTDQNYLNGGVTLIAGNGSIGVAATGAAVNLNGGTLVANATFTLDNAGANARPVNLLANGGGLAAIAGSTLTVDGVVGSAVDGGPLTIGLTNAAGLLPGTGPGTANSAVYATGTVVLTYPNYFYGGTVLQGGTLNINGIYALGGADYGGVTFNGGTLQYAASFPGTNGSADLTSIGTAGVTLAAGGGTIDLNGNAIIYAGSIGNNGTGSLTVKSSLAGGSLNLQGANTYAGTTTVTNALLSVNNAAGSGTGAGNVVVQNNATLAGNGTIAGSVSVLAGGALAVGNTNDSLTLSHNLTLNAGSTTRLQILHAPLNNSSVSAGNTITFGGTLVVTNLGGPIARGDTFTLLSAPNLTGNFAALVLPGLTNGLVWDTNSLLTSGTLTAVAVTNPVITSFTFSNGQFNVTGSGGVAGSYYYILTTTNLATPLTNWIAVATNQFNAAGNFSAAVSIPTNLPAGFYTLQMQ